MAEHILGTLLFNIELSDFKMQTLFFTESQVLSVDTLQITEQFKELQEAEKTGINLTLWKLAFALSGGGIGGAALIATYFYSLEKSLDKLDDLKNKILEAGIPTADYNTYELTPKIYELVDKSKNRFPYEKMSKFSAVEGHLFLRKNTEVMLTAHAGLFGANWVTLSNFEEIKKVVGQTPLTKKLSLKEIGTK